MKESFLHFVWKTLSFEPRGLETVEGVPIHIYQTGFHNQNAGPDFLQGSVKVGYEKLMGHVEIHLETEDWYRHSHDTDPGYNPVVLHVVLHSSGRAVIREDGTQIPEISLEGRIPGEIIRNHDRLNLATETIPCAGSLASVPEYTVLSMLERMGVARIESKGKLLGEHLQERVVDWEQILWEELAASLAGPVNGNAFREICRQIHAGLMRKHRHNRFQLEAMLFGAAGFLAGDPPDAYLSTLKAEWNFLAAKYELKPAFEPVKFMRMRPASFPTIRLSQLAGICSRFPVLLELLTADRMQILLNAEIGVSEYWESHFRPGIPTRRQPRRMGVDLKHRVLINTLIPLAWLYLSAHGRDFLPEVISGAMEIIPAESNRITAQFAALGIKPANALQSQGMIELKRNLCDEKKCLTCAIGYKILTNGRNESGRLSHSDRRNRGRSEDSLRDINSTGSDSTRLSDHGRIAG